MRDLAGRTAFVTGGDSGIGLATAEAFCAAGMRVVVCGLTEDSVGAAAERLSAHGEATGVVLDVRDRAAFAEVADRIERDHGGLDVLFNNAGVGFLGPALSSSFEQWDWVMGINLTGVYNGIRTFVPRMLAAGRPGHVVSTASIAGLIGAKGTIYSTAKFGVVGLTESLALELRGTQIGISVLIPGMVGTNIRHGPTPPGDAPPAPPAPTPGLAELPIMAAQEVGQRVLQGILDDDLYILTHGEHRELVASRSRALDRSMPTGEFDPGRVTRELTIMSNPIYDEQRPAGSGDASPGNAF